MTFLRSGQNFSGKVQTVSILDFAGPVVSVPTLQLCNYFSEVITDTDTPVGVGGAVFQSNFSMDTKI